MRRPRDCKTIDDVCEIQRDNKDVGDFWMITDGYTVSIHEQKMGEPSKQQISIPRATFNKLIDWYSRPQKITEAA
jgi:hypothetical protein